MDAETIKRWLETKAEMSFSRSSGPGGQNVNKVNSKTTIRVDLNQLEGISEEERSRLISKLQSRLTGPKKPPKNPQTDLQPETGSDVESPFFASELILQVQDERSQLQNRELAVERAFALIAKALHREKPRRATKPSRASKERRMTSKKIAGSHKKNRGKPTLE